TGVAVLGARGLVFKTAVAVLAIAAGVVAVRWARSRPTERLAAVSSDEPPAERVTPVRRAPPRLLGAAPAPGAPGAGRPGGAMPALAAATPAADGRLDVTEALKRAAE